MYIHQLMDMDTDSWPIWQNHNSGLSAILKLRGDSIFESEMGTHLFRWINPQLAAKDFVYGTHYCVKLSTVSKFARPIGAEAAELMQKILELVRRLRAVTRRPEYEDSECELQSILGEALYLDQVIGSLSASSSKAYKKFEKSLINTDNVRSLPYHPFLMILTSIIVPHRTPRTRHGRQKLRRRQKCLHWP